jgi:hypothetical protein
MVVITKRIDMVRKNKLKEFLEISEEVSELFENARKEDEKNANDFWNSLSYDDKCKAFYAVVSRIYEGDIRLKGSYRYVLYDVFGFGPEMYTRGMDCGYMALHNSIMTDEQFAKSNEWMLNDGKPNQTNSE